MFLVSSFSFIAECRLRFLVSQLNMYKIHLVRGLAMLVYKQAQNVHQCSKHTLTHCYHKDLLRRPTLRKGMGQWETGMAGIDDRV